MLQTDEHVMISARENFPCFLFRVFLFILSQLCFQAHTLTNHANFEFEKSLSSCEKPCYNGVCLNKACVCSKGWYGTQCDHCFGRIRLSENTSSISDGPLDYSSSAKCTWLIEPENSATPLTIRINSFFTECGWDYLYIYDGDSVYGKQLAALCGEQPTQEFTAASGKALVHFFSDLAMNLNGFNVSYESNSCAYNCSSHGSCTAGKCVCEDGFKGQYCEHQVCKLNEKSTENPCHEGHCVDGKCECLSTNVHGETCQTPITSSVWDLIHPFNDAPTGKASHASITIDDTIWNIGGEYFDGSVDPNNIDVYNVTSREWSKVAVSGDVPTPRFDHTVVKYKNKIYMYGGVTKTRKRHVTTQAATNELWVFDMTTKSWTEQNHKNETIIAAPFAVAGHSAHVIGSEMFVIFGYNPLFGFLHHVQIYNFETDEWSVANISDHVYGRFKHTAVEYTTPSGSIAILVYGGSMWNNTITDSLMQFDTAAKKWTNLPQSGVQLYLHTAVYLNGLMVVVGGRGANMTAGSKSECFSNMVQSYDVACKQWSNMSMAPAELKRYGHVAHVIGQKMYLLGGYDGKMMNDVWTFSPARCSSTTRPDECRLVSDGTKCVFIDSSCVPFDPTVSYKSTFNSVIKSSSPKSFDECTNTPLRLALKTCEEQTDCVSCASKSGCGWCSSGEQCLPNEQECVDGPGMLTSWEKCSQHNSVASMRPCNMENNCGSCRVSPHCTWYPIDKSSPCVSKEDLIAVVYEYETKSVLSDRSKFLSPSHFPSLSRSIFRNTSECPMPCAQRNNCSDCTELDQCMWCPSTNRCINLEAYTLSFAYGQCHSWVTSGSGNVLRRVCQAESSICEEHKTCGECQRDPGCGWLADDSKTGLGLCIRGAATGPLEGKPENSTWHFIDCPACQCNGHSTCITSVGSFPPVTIEKCQSCQNNTIGAHCGSCAPGFYGDARNGGICQKCDCNGQADMCDPQSGQCYCRTKGVTGDHCDKCEIKYLGTPSKGTPCYYELAVDFIFTFKLKADDKDNHTSEIYLYSVPYKKDTDVTFQISCESPKGNALVALNMTSSYMDGLPERTQTMMVDTICDSKGFRRVYVASDKGYPFGPDSNTTFFVRVYNFQTPVQIVVSFAQSPPINWVLFFVIFAACFIVLLVVAGLLWMIKVRIEAYRRNQRRIDEIEHMASRPFASTKMELSMLSQFSSAGGPTPLSIEPCHNYRAGVFTLAVRLPTGGKGVTPSGTSGLAVASSLCLLTPQQVGVLQAQENGESSGGRKSNFRNFLATMRQRPNNSD
ncbi:hypothetical protein GCK72_025653 [Caenorhabditis remanei]|uniref:Uncharacterized protein n=1 Tax=Caenorhabditis remanei TaxID=31234 RepID=A0A6A5G2R3_CAERE|nr:hypothetical protein GCK72_025653 [Caenorhabditis remanei]KAF1749186.1 hypothetical protein GCK72_025653 [Caenorhabditis remanei]